MIEDAQPNEQVLSRKGAAIPMVHPAQGKTSTLARRHYPAPNYYSRTQATTSNYQQSGTYDSSQYQHRRHNYPHDTWQAKRMRIERDSGARYADSSHKPTSTTLTSYPKARKFRKPEPTELLVDVPPECRKGAPGCQKLRKQWIALQIKEIQTNIGVKVHFCGYLENSARFTCADDQPLVAKVIDSGSHLPTDVDAQPDVDMQDEIIISDYLIDVDAELSEVVHEQPSLSANGEQSVVSINGQDIGLYKFPPDLHLAEGTTVLPPSASEAVEPLRVFSSGVLSVSPPGPARSPSLGAPKAQPRAASVLNLTVVDACSPYVDQTDNDHLDIDSTSIPIPRAQESAADTPSAFGVGQIPTSKTDTIHLFNYEPQHLDTVSHTLEDQLSRHMPVRKLKADSIPIQIPTQQYDKPRRILSLATISSVVNVSMRGSFDVVDVMPLRHRRTLNAPSLQGALIDDACLLQAGSSCLAVLGHARDQEQLSWCRIQVNENQLSDAFPLTRPWNTSKKGGVSAVASMLQPLQFATGGYDHVVHLWEVETDFSTASPRSLAIKHSSQIQSLLAIRDTSHKLISAAADCNVHFWDLSSERVVNTVKTSNVPYHAHSTTSPFCTLLEVAHRELQFEVRDHRLIPERPVQRFGYTADKVHGRFIKGDVMSNLFACGERNGLVRLWDMRNLKATPETVDCGQGQKIVQVLFNQSRLVVCSENGQMSLFKHSL